ncbi:Acyl-CoA N-acyltransferases (Nat) [Glarea lozoyensis ATCC 20868]|uniref:Acyl-CoA N-acyltransferases (Nat) n=1 Tax=Glarea lozoyensis (strain ATCC 20868 / MF5171) TaxID=1116229 RepID=S3DGT3_GLAL2|nr:Acyl-CoA N-acyltransferases (Nat) [Glarea lozoyensis ATCC 20868]EPE36334.1 Acyl-CoA N-acyltransferases (Nat) [Glarea lozoyensis ATCC 20868]
MDFEIIKIARDDATVRSYVERYKAFRLLSLQTAPDMFGSTYEREIAFSEDTWLGRLSSPMATTFLAIQENRVIGTITTVGPLPFLPEEIAPTSNPWTALDGTNKKPLYSHFRVNGMFTLPDVRGRGVAKALMRESIKQAIQDATDSETEYMSSIVVDADNPSAVGLYRKFGYHTIGEEPRSPGSARKALLMKYSPDEDAKALLQT